MGISIIIDALEQNYKEQFEQIPREDPYMALYDKLIKDDTIFLVYRKKKEEDNYKYIGYVRTGANELKENPEKWFNDEFKIVKLEIPKTLENNESFFELIAHDILKRSEKALEEQKLGGN